MERGRPVRLRRVDAMGCTEGIVVEAGGAPAVLSAGGTPALPSAGGAPTVLYASEAPAVPFCTLNAGISTRQIA